MTGPNSVDSLRVYGESEPVPETDTHDGNSKIACGDLRGDRFASIQLVAGNVIPKAIKFATIAQFPEHCTTSFHADGHRFRQRNVHPEHRRYPNRLARTPQ